MGNGYRISKKNKIMKFNNETIRIAVEEWLDDSKKAEETYGH